MVISAKWKGLRILHFIVGVALENALPLPLPVRLLAQGFAFNTRSDAVLHLDHEFVAVNPLVDFVALLGPFLDCRREIHDATEFYGETDRTRAGFDVVEALAR